MRYTMPILSHHIQHQGEPHEGPTIQPKKPEKATRRPNGPRTAQAEKGRGP